MVNSVKWNIYDLLHMLYKAFPIFSFKLIKIILFFPFSTSQKWYKGTPEKNRDYERRKERGQSHQRWSRVFRNSGGATKEVNRLINWSSLLWLFNQWPTSSQYLAHISTPFPKKYIVRKFIMCQNPYTQNILFSPTLLD